MRSFIALATLALALGLLTAIPASAAAPPLAQAAGGGAPPIIPALVNVRILRAQAALDRAVEYADEAQADKAVISMTAARTNLRKAWTGAKYMIENAPPPVAGGAAVGRAAGGAIGNGYASIYDTAFAVLTLQDSVATTSVGLIDTAKGTLQSALSTTIFAALNDRDAAVAYIKSKDVAAPAGTVVAGWGGVMPNAAAQLDDEITQIDGTLAAKPSSGAAKVLKAAQAQDIKTQRNINKYWPPLPAG